MPNLKGEVCAMSHFDAQKGSQLPSQVGLVEFVCPGKRVVEQLAGEEGAPAVVEFEDKTVVE